MQSRLEHRKQDRGRSFADAGDRATARSNMPRPSPPCDLRWHETILGLIDGGAILEEPAARNTPLYAITN
ncbi:MAG: hypothetical protein U1E16_04770 [Hyphomicrobiales bacterium]